MGWLRNRRNNRSGDLVERILRSVTLEKGSLTEISARVGVRVGTVYPVVWELERRGLLESSWEIRNDDLPRRKFYRTSYFYRCTPGT